MCVSAVCGVTPPAAPMQAWHYTEKKTERDSERDSECDAERDTERDTKRDTKRDTERDNEVTAGHWVVLKSLKWKSVSVSLSVWLTCIYLDVWQRLSHACAHVYILVHTWHVISHVAGLDEYEYTHVHAHIRYA